MSFTLHLMHSGESNANTARRRRRLGILAAVCWVLLIPSCLAWLVNLEIALRVFFPGLRLVEPLMPGFGVLAADLSTISTLVPVLLVLFPLIMAHRLRGLGSAADEHVGRLVYDPYPPHFPFFLVMLGLAGTLYGLLIGLDVSGVGELGGEIPSPDTIRMTLDRLLGGTATALLSSLLGLAGAFLAARPLTWIFHRTAMLPAQDEPPGLTATFLGLIEGLQSLDTAARSFSERLEGTDWRAMPESLNAIREDLALWRQEASAVREQLDALADAQRTGHERLLPLARLEKLDQLDNLERHLASLAASADESRNLQSRQLDLMERELARRETAEQNLSDRLEGIREEVRSLLARMEGVERETAGSREALDSLLREAERAIAQADGQAAASAEQRDAIIRELREGSRDREADRTALRRAFGQFLANEDADRRDRDGGRAAGK